MKTLTCPSKPWTLPNTRGLFKIRHESFIKYLVLKLSEQSQITSNLFININYNYRIYRSNKKKTLSNFSGYFDSDINQQRAVIYFLDKIIENTSTDVILVSIPRPNDYERLKNGSDLSNIFWNKYYVNKDSSNSNFKFIDLINYVPSNLDEMYLKCDGHWSPKGNLWAARIISEFIRKN